MAAGQPGTTVASCHAELLWAHPLSTLGQLWKPALPFADQWPQGSTPNPGAVSGFIAPRPMGMR